MSFGCGIQMKILMLILASDSAPEYIEFQKVWRSYMHSNPNIHCFFYKGDPNLSQDAILSGDTLLIKLEESLENVYEKTILAFKYFEPVLHQYDFVYRTNLSSFIDFGKYIDVCQTFPKTEGCIAFVGMTGDGVSFPSGSGFTLSPDLVRRFVKDPPPKIEQDDITFGVALNNWGIPIHSVSRADYSRDVGDFVYRIPEMPTFHYRIKTDNRKHDIEIMRALARNFYPSLRAHMAQPLTYQTPRVTNDRPWKSLY
jgi:hypothetical protein